MTDRHMGYVVVLDKDIHEDDAEHVINALRMVKGVCEVTSVVNDVSVAMLAEMRLRVQLRERVVNAVLEQFDSTERTS